MTIWKTIRISSEAIVVVVVATSAKGAGDHARRGKEEGNESGLAGDHDGSYWLVDHGMDGTKSDDGREESLVYLASSRHAGLRVDVGDLKTTRQIITTKMTKMTA